jgi:signal transduction histidine kinase
MKLPLQARFSAVIVGLIALLVVNLSGVLYVQFNEIMGEMQRSNAIAMRDALLSQTRIQGVNQAHYLAESTADDLGHGRIDRLREIVSLAKMQAGVDYILLCDAQGRIVTDGSKELKPFAKQPPFPLPPEVMALKDGENLIIDDVLHISAPVTVESRQIGEIKMGYSLAAIRGTIDAAGAAFDEISDRGRSEHIYATAIGMVILVVLGILLSVLVSRWLTRPIEVDFRMRSADLEKANDALIGEIAERHRAEARFTQLQADLAHIGRLGTVGELAGGLAHELNQPLAVISSYASGGLARLRSGSAGPKEMFDAFEKIVDQVGRAGEIIRWIREFVRKAEPRRVWVDVNAVIHEAVAVLGQEPRRYGVDVQLDLSADLPRVAADKIQVQQAILNLVGNALDSLRGGNIPGRIVVRSLKRGRNFVQVDVEDTGPGLPPDIRDKAFDPFFTTKQNGLGLGLSLCRSIIETHGGELWATSGGERGAIFHFTLPVEEVNRRRDDA